MTAPMFQPYLVPKVCSTKGCPVTWNGQSFRKPEPDQAPVRAKCPACLERHEKDLRRIATRPRTQITTRVHPTADYDQPFPPLRRVG